MFRRSPTGAAPVRALTLGAVALLVAALAALGLFGGAGLPERTGPPIEELAVERTVFSPGVIELTVRNVGPDPVRIAQVFVNDVYVDVTGATEPIGRLATDTVRLDYPWQDGQPYLVSMLTSTGLVIEHEIPAAVPTPQAGPGLYGTMALLGTYVGVIPVLLGMLVLPVVRRAGPATVRVLLAVTVGLLAFLAVDGTIEGVGLAERAGGAFGGPVLVFLGAGLAYLLLSAVDQWLNRRRQPGDEIDRSGPRLALMIAIGIGLHNLGEGLAIGSAYAIGELALGTALVVGFALHNTTEGVAVVAPLTARRPSAPLLLGLGLLAGAPAILGAVLGASVDDAALSAFLLGIGVGAIVQVVVQLAPALRHRPSGGLAPSTLGGIAAGMAIMYVTGLLVAA